MVKRMGKQSGFTIVELLIVVVVIAILAAITIISYNGIQNRAYDSAVQSDMENFAKAVQLQNAEFSAYPFPLTKAMGIKVSRNAYMVRNNVYYCVNTTTNQFALGSISKSGKGFSYTPSAGMQSYADGQANVSGGNTCALVGLSYNSAYGVYALDAGSGWNTTWLN